MKIWNGRGFGIRKDGKTRQAKHCYVCANSRSDAVRLINEAAGWKAMTDYEIKHYYVEGAWGNTMDGITPERGVWVTWPDGTWGGKLERLI